MAFTTAETAAHAQASGHLSTAHQELGAVQTGLANTAATHVNNPSTWVTDGARVFGQALASYDAELTKFRTFLQQMVENMASSGAHYTSGISNEAAAVQRFLSLLG